MQAATYDCREYLPEAQDVHVSAPASTPVLVIEPALQARHAATFEVVVYFPATQSVQVLAPEAMPVLVINPAAHVVQSASVFEPTTPTNFPGCSRCRPRLPTEGNICQRHKGCT